MYLCLCLCDHQHILSLGGLVVKEIIRPAELSSHLYTFEQKPKLVKKQNKQPSRNASQSHSSKSTSKITMAKEKEHKDQNAVEEDTEELVEEKPVRKPPHKASNPKKTLPSTDHTNTPVAMVDPITLDDSAHSKNASTNKRKVVTHNEQAERTLVLQPMSPKSKESFGSSLMKVCIVYVCVHVRAHTHTHTNTHSNLLCIIFSGNVPVRELPCY